MEEAPGKISRPRFLSLFRLFLLGLFGLCMLSLQDKFDEEAKRQRVAEFIVEPKAQLQVKRSADALSATKSHSPGPDYQEDKEGRHMQA